MQSHCIANVHNRGMEDALARVSSLNIVVKTTTQRHGQLERHAAGK